MLRVDDDTALGDDGAVTRSGAAWTRSRPVSTACTTAAAISCAGTCDVPYDEVFVGTASNSAPARTDEWLRPA